MKKIDEEKKMAELLESSLKKTEQEPEENNKTEMEEFFNISNEMEEEEEPDYLKDIDISEEIIESFENSESYKSADEMTDEIIALTNRLDEQFKKKEEEPEKKSKQENKKYHVGSLSAALALLYAGITLIYGLSVPNGILFAFRFSPVILIFLGIEIIINICFTRSFKVKLDLFGFTLSAGIILTSCITSVSFLGISNSETTREKTEKRLESEFILALTEEFIVFNKITKLAENEILIGNIEADILLFGEDLYAYQDIYDINKNDTVNIKIYFNTAQKTLIKFAEDCVKTFEVLNETDYFKHSSGNIEFIGTDRGNYIHVSLNKKLQNNISAAEIAKLADYVAENLSTDTDDLIYTEE